MNLKRRVQSGAKVRSDTAPPTSFQCPGSLENCSHYLVQLPGSSEPAVGPIAVISLASVRSVGFLVIQGRHPYTGAVRLSCAFPLAAQHPCCSRMCTDEFVPCS
uniref:Uncharacterized protein n=1 Tax=Physcomitrium patens TaxID=3218 RepID=A0A7I4C5D5_PHYPA